MAWFWEIGYVGFAVLRLDAGASTLACMAEGQGTELQNDGHSKRGFS